MKKLILIGGPMGVGKTTVSRELQRLISPCAFLDGDWCWDIHPFTVTEETKRMAFDHIFFLLDGYGKSTACSNIIFCWVMHTDAIWKHMMQKLRAVDCQVYPVMLLCSEQALKKRLEDDIAAGRREKDCVKRSLERLKQCKKVTSAPQIDTTNLTVRQTAEKIAAMLKE